MSLKLGPFAIEQRLARGGMGEVWQAHHISTQAKAAVKLLTGPRADEAEFQNEFRREVQSTARLDHPNVIRIFDYGTLPDNADEAGLVPLLPYYVMEFCEHGSLQNRLDELTWEITREVLHTLLIALAHAHARGVIHRDIKPANILLRDAQGGQVLLTDFGIAHATDRATRTDGADLTSRSVEDATGTPKYMAPEQFMGRWRDYGAWTDLYAVGILAFQMVSGKSPFTEVNFMMYAMAHMNKPVPALVPRFDIPEGFEDWLRKMMDKDPRGRFQHAADAAWALSKLVDPESSTRTGEAAEAVGAEEDATMDTIMEDAVSASWKISDSAPDAAGTTQNHPTRPPVPLTWQLAEQEAEFRPMPGAGLGLLGIRPSPFSGREGERKELWDALHQSQLNTRLVIIDGESGCGKTTLAQWLAYHAAECGAASVLYTSHDLRPGARHGLGWMLASHYRTAGLPAEETLARVRTFFDLNMPQADLQARALTEIVRQHFATSDADNDVPVLQIASPAARHGFVLKALIHEAEKRPVLVWLDDAHFDADTLAFVHFALSMPLGDVPLLFLLTTTREIASPDAREYLDALAAHERCTSIALPQLDHQTIAVVLERMGLDDEVAKQVTKQSGANTLFAIQLVQDWVNRGVLRLEGARLHLDAAEIGHESMVTDLADVWRNQLESIVSTFSVSRQVDGEHSRVSIPSESMWTLLELAAAFGREVDLAEWSTATPLMGMPDVVEIFDELAERGLGALRDHQFTFVNDGLRKILIESSTTRDTWTKINRVLARMLTSRYGQDHPGLALRVARHFFEAGDFPIASMCLDEAYTRAFRTGNQDKLAEVLDLQEKCLEGGNKPPTSTAWGALWLKQSKALVWRSEPELRDEGTRLLVGAEAIARGKSDRQLLAKVLNTKGWLADFRGEYDEGIIALNEAIDVAPDNVERAIAHRLLGHLYAQMSDMQASREHYTQSAALTRDPVDTFSAHQGLFFCDRAANDLDGAERHLLASSAIAEENGLMLGMAFVHENVAVLAASRGKWADTLPALKKALELHEVLGPKSPPANTARGQLIRAYLVNDEIEAARQLFESLPAEFQTTLPDVQAFLIVAENKNIGADLQALVAAMPHGEPLTDAVLAKLSQH